MEKALRVLFLWRTEVEEQREFAADMRQRNEALVYNILPQHVAAHFLRQRTRQHEELYADSFAEVGVLFASMPNFSGRSAGDNIVTKWYDNLLFVKEVTFIVNDASFRCRAIFHSHWPDALRGAGWTRT